MVLQLNIQPVAKEGGEPGQPGLSSLALAGSQQLVQGAAPAARQADQPGGMRGKLLERQGVFRRGQDAAEAAQAAPAGEIHGQQGQRARGGRWQLSSGQDGGRQAQQRLNAGLLAGQGKLDRAGQAVMVGEGQRGHALRRGSLGERLG